MTIGSSQIRRHGVSRRCLHRGKRIGIRGNIVVRAFCLGGSNCHRTDTLDGHLAGAVDLGISVTCRNRPGNSTVAGATRGRKGEAAAISNIASGLTGNSEAFLGCLADGKVLFRTATVVTREGHRNLTRSCIGVIAVAHRVVRSLGQYSITILDGHSGCLCRAIVGEAVLAQRNIGCAQSLGINRHSASGGFSACRGGDGRRTHVLRGNLTIAIHGGDALGTGTPSHSLISGIVGQHRCRQLLRTAHSDARTALIQRHASDCNRLCLQLQVVAIYNHIINRIVAFEFICVPVFEGGNICPVRLGKDASCRHSHADVCAACKSFVHRYRLSTIKPQVIICSVYLVSGNHDVIRHLKL